MVELIMEAGACYSRGEFDRVRAIGHLLELAGEDLTKVGLEQDSAKRG